MTMANDLPYWKPPASNSSMGTASGLACACERRMNLQSANQKGLTKYWDEAVSDTKMARDNP